ncbi:TPA: nucleotide exchange factor GrpE [bacterium]|nr:nucleotide exchange factor GrpE [bacterium]
MVEIEKELMRKIKRKKKIELIAEIEEKDVQIEEYLNLARRIKADFENYKKQQEKQSKELKNIYQSNVIFELLPVYDNLERALNQRSGDTEKFIEGISFIKKQFEDILAKIGAQRIKAIGEEFDPRFHVALSAIPSKEHKENSIIDEIQSGWLYNEICIRPSQVIIGAKWQEEKTSSPME